MAGRGASVPSLALMVLALLQRTTTTEVKSQDTARWELFESCSRPCRQGAEVHGARRCVRGFEVVPDVFCQSSAHAGPACRTCVAAWSIGSWSVCSVSCGDGQQTRDVSCQIADRSGQLYRAPVVECPSPAPQATRPCHETDCPQADEDVSASILAENYTLIQFRRGKTIRVTVGGEVNILSGQTLVIKCPVQHFSKDLVTWSKGHKLVTLMKQSQGPHVVGTKLRIDRANPKRDYGVYTCTAGTVSSTVTVRFIKQGDNQLAEYSDWLKKLKIQQRLEKSEWYDLKHTNITHDFLQQRDQRDQSKKVTSLAYQTLDWSNCSSTCSAKGNRTRSVVCANVASAYLKIVDDLECKKAGLYKPASVEACWEPCKAVWRNGTWTKCQGKCGQIGYTTTHVTCVWDGDMSPADGKCLPESKPQTRKYCYLPSCSKCSDSSRSCSLIHRLKMCRYTVFSSLCCQTCQSGKYFG
ncbi:ADAMTS-like protein 1 [Physella acuta]|uniref:ADAMTS-like protein 1 n=1 Tax=Physella acuta TaxID=109671 RepID=UPI0027DACA21|nr:ADAMTS-like protein 1 [Physella acuta]XP_059175462.1 ADAMTS-like protein 1 [Physella acuta]